MTIEHRDSPIRHATYRAFRKRLVVTVALVAVALLVTGGVARSNKATWFDRPISSVSANASH